jgi:hypothetical protein
MFTPSTPFGNKKPFSVVYEFTSKVSIRITNNGTSGNKNGTVLSFLPVSRIALTICTVFGTMMYPSLQIAECIEHLITLHVHVPAFSTIATTGTSMVHLIFTSHRCAALTATTTFDIYISHIEEAPFWTNTINSLVSVGTGTDAK